MPKKKKEKEKVEEEEVYHVEVITKARVNEDSEWEYRVKWAGYASDADSWEPAENVKQCERLLTSFWKHIGTDDNDYAIGYETAASEDWINKEKQYFRETFGKSSKRKSDKASESKKDKQKPRSITSLVSEGTSDDSKSSDEEPSVKKPSRRGLNRMARVVDTSDSESEPDGKSRKQAKVASRVAPRSKVTPPPSKEPSQVKRHELPAASGSSTSIAPPKVTAIRTHQDQRSHPLVKPMNLPTRSVEAGSSLSTKQRVAAGILPPLAGPKPLPPPPKKSLPALSFKKNKPAIPPIQTKDTSVPIASVAIPVSPRVQTAPVTNDMDIVASPLQMDIDQSFDPWGSISDDAAPPVGSSETLMVPIPPKSQSEIDAEMFLETITVPVEVGTDQSTMKLTKPVAIPRIPKKWKWSGDLFVSTSENKTELLCAVTIADSTVTSNTSHINLLLSSVDSLRISRLYPVVELSSLLRACGKPQYFGTLESTEPNDDVIIHGLEHHLTNEGLAMAIPLLHKGIEAAVLIVFPGTQQKMTKALQVPEQLSGAPLLVVLLPFVVAAVTCTAVAGQRPIKAVIQSFHNTQGVEIPHEPIQDALLYQAMSLLGFPKLLLDFLNSSTRTYSIWPLPDQMSPGLDTVMLQYVLKSTKAVLAKLEEDPRVIFISNHHLDMLHTIPSLATKLANSPEIQFWTYGYSTYVTCQKWKLQEIYPLGGIVTFTSSALIEDLIGCYQLMSKIIEHPLWDCYLLPEVLAVSHLLCGSGGLSSSSCLSDESHLRPILDLIHHGLISVVKLPEKEHSDQTSWLSQVLSHSSASGLELLEVYLGALRSHSVTLDMTPEQLITFTNTEITKGLLGAQIHPAFMENYRRFVVIGAASEHTISPDKNGLEWSSISTFSFKDDYFQS